MRFYADLHVHSRYSRATSRDCDLEHLAAQALRKGIQVVGTGDFTHPGWADELAGKLVPAEPGLFRLRPDLERAATLASPPTCRGEVRFLLEVEISTIYKKSGRTRKVHHLVFASDLAEAAALRARLATIGNLAADGRPILGLDSRDLLEVVLETAPGGFLVPAHVWTPWFAVLGSSSGFDSVEECFGDLAPHVFALETGLSSDPAMNWRLSALDRYRLISNSDAHSPGKLGREACVFDCALDYFEMRRALETGKGFAGTIEFFPEEGKYHLDGHRSCNQRLTPAETRASGGNCPACGKPVTVGVLHRVETLADRPEGIRPPGAAPYRSLVPLSEILAEILRVGARSGAVAQAYQGLLTRLGPELWTLEQVPIEEVRRAEPSLLAEALRRLRRGEVQREAGYDGEYGAIRLFHPQEVESVTSSALLFEPPSVLAPISAARRAGQSPAIPRPAVAPAEPALSASTAPLVQEVAPTLSGLDAEQLAAARVREGPLLILAGPGTGKTRTLTHRLAWLLSEGIPAEQCLVLTFTRRAAGELRERLDELVPDEARRVTVATFHGMGLMLLHEHADRLGLPSDVGVLDAAAQEALVVEKTGSSPRGARHLLAEISRHKRTLGRHALDGEAATAFARYQQALSAARAVDWDDLVRLPVALLESDPEIRADLRRRFAWISVDEFQDVDALQYRLLTLLAPPQGNLCAIGDPDQAIYGFRGSDVALFWRFLEDFPSTRQVRLDRNYRSAGPIIRAALQAIKPTSLVPGRELIAVAGGERRVALHAAVSERAEAEFVVQSIERLLAGHTFFSVDTGRAGDGVGQGYSLADFAVLFRTEAQVEVLSEALSRSGLPFQAPGDDPEAFDPRAERISLLTLHAAKGLEFRVVFIAGCEDGLLPLRFGSQLASSPEEERRLFFVGMTRARERLFLCRARKRVLHGQVHDREPSPFLLDIEKALVEIQETEQRSCARPARSNQLALL